jgi:hypothetical protein
MLYSRLSYITAIIKENWTAFVWSTAFSTLLSFFFIQIQYTGFIWQPYDQIDPGLIDAVLKTRAEFVSTYRTQNQRENVHAGEDSVISHNIDMTYQSEPQTYHTTANHESFEEVRKHQQQLTAAEVQSPGTQTNTTPATMTVTTSTSTSIHSINILPPLNPTPPRINNFVNAKGIMSRQQLINLHANVSSLNQLLIDCLKVILFYAGMY